METQTIMTIIGVIMAIIAVAELIVAVRHARLTRKLKSKVDLNSAQVQAALEEKATKEEVQALKLDIEPTVRRIVLTVLQEMVQQYANPRLADQRRSSDADSR